MIELKNRSAKELCKFKMAEPSELIRHDQAQQGLSENSSKQC